MKTQYIVGRPMNINGTHFEPGDELKREHVEAIPRLESFISGRFIFPVATERDRKSLPNFVIAKLKTRKEAKEAAHKSTPVVETDKTIKAREGRDTDRVRLRAKAEAEQQEIIYAARNNQEEPEVKEKERKNLISMTLKPAQAADPGPQDGEEQNPETDAAPTDSVPAEADSEPEAKDSDGGTDDGVNIPKPEEPAVSDSGFDPSNHSVAQVKDYIEQNPKEEESILAAERKGKKRKGLVGEV